LIDIKEPCKEAQVYAIENYSWILHSFRNPCSEAIDALIKKDDMTYLRYVEHIPAILQIKMIKKSIFNTRYIKNQDVQLHEYILKKNNLCFFNHIKNPSEDIVIKMLESLNIKPYKRLVFRFSQYLMFSHLRSYFKNEISKEVQCKVIKKVSPEIAEFVINSGFCNEAKQVYEKIKLMRDACE